MTKSGAWVLIALSVNTRVLSASEEKFFWKSTILECRNQNTRVLEILGVNTGSVDIECWWIVKIFCSTLEWWKAGTRVLAMLAVNTCSVGFQCWELGHNTRVLKRLCSSVDSAEGFHCQKPQHSSEEKLALECWLVLWANAGSVSWQCWEKDQHSSAVILALEYWQYFQPILEVLT